MQDTLGLDVDQRIADGISEALATRELIGEIQEKLSALRPRLGSLQCDCRLRDFDLWLTERKTATSAHLDALNRWQTEREVG